MLFIGDVHGKTDAYQKIVERAPYSIQVGDFGFHKEWAWLKKNVNAEHHKVVCGNHDLPPSENDAPHCLGNFGSIIHGGLPLFFVRGAHSIDASYRTEGVSWFADEQLNHLDLLDAIAEYERVRPDIVVTHEAPAYLKMMLCGQAYDQTSIALDQMWGVHRPRLWIHGHHHKSARYELLGTQFISLAELEVFKL